MAKNYNRANWVFGRKDNILKDKTALIDQYIRYMLVRTQQMFEYGNLPTTIPAREIELLTQTSRFVVWKRVKGELYVFFGGLGGIPNEYYHPTKAIVTNPYLKYSEQLEIDKDCVVMWNDSIHVGLLPMFEKYASMLAETDISLRLACVNARIPAFIKATTDNERASAEEVIKKIDDGIELGVIGSDAFFDGIKTEEYASRGTSSIKDLIELQQFYKASWFNELGINSNYNMKREAINEEEASMNEDALLPLIDDMLKQRKIAIDKVNQMFGTNISVELSSAWKKIRKDIVRAEHEQESSDNDSKGEDDETL